MSQKIKLSQRLLASQASSSKFNNETKYIWVLQSAPCKKGLRILGDLIYKMIDQRKKKFKVCERKAEMKHNKWKC